MLSAYFAASEVVYILRHISITLCHHWIHIHMHICIVALYYLSLSNSHDCVIAVIYHNGAGFVDRLHRLLDVSSEQTIIPHFSLVLQRQAIEIRALHEQHMYPRVCGNMYVYTDMSHVSIVSDIHCFSHSANLMKIKSICHINRSPRSTSKTVTHPLWCVR